MKNFLSLFLTFFLVTALYSCSNEDTFTGKANWEFTIKSVISTSPAITGYPQTTTTTVTNNDLTSAEADAIVQQYTTTLKQSQYIAGFGTLTVTVKSTCTKRKI
jgi:hypothetical protein